MSTDKNKPDAPASRFRGGIPHYHRSNKLDDDGWDDWTGDRLKKSSSQKKERVIHGIGAVIIGCLLLIVLFSTVYFFWDKVLSILG